MDIPAICCATPLSQEGTEFMQNRNYGSCYTPTAGKLSERKNECSSEHIVELEGNNCDSCTIDKLNNLSTLADAASAETENVSEFNSKKNGNSSCCESDNITHAGQEPDRLKSCEMTPIDMSVFIARVQQQCESVSQSNFNVKSKGRKEAIVNIDDSDDDCDNCNIDMDEQSPFTVEVHNKKLTQEQDRKLSGDIETFLINNTQTAINSIGLLIEKTAEQNVIPRNCQINTRSCCNVCKSGCNDTTKKNVDKPQEQHVSITCTGTKPYENPYFKCSVCDITFLMPNDLTVHLRSHYDPAQEDNLAITGHLNKDYNNAIVNHDQNLGIVPEFRKQGSYLQCTDCGISFHESMISMIEQDIVTVFDNDKRKIADGRKELGICKHKNILKKDGPMKEFTYCSDCGLVIESELKSNQSSDADCTSKSIISKTYNLVTEMEQASHVQVTSTPNNVSESLTYVNVQVSHSEINSQSPESNMNKLDCLTANKSVNLSSENNSGYQCNSLARQKFKCFSCEGINFLSAEELRDHFEQVHKCKEDECFTCDKCNQRFLAETTLIAHLKVHTAKKLHTCKTCSKVFKTISELRRHQQKIHKNQRPFICDVCQKCFKTRWELSAHAKIHNDAKQFICNFCSKCYKVKLDLEAHVLMHTSERPFECQYCDKKFKTRKECNIHQRIHTGEKPFCCEHCSSCFKSKKELKAHQRVHTKLRPFPCIVCGKDFKTKKDLLQHAQRVHSDDRPFVCDGCGKRFKSKKEIKPHFLRMHTNEKSFSCNFCNKQFVKKQELDVHIKRKHKLD